MISFRMRCASLENASSEQTLSAFDRAAERDLIGELEIASVRHAARDPRDAHVFPGELAREKKRGRLAVDRRGGSDEHLCDLPFAETAAERRERKIVGSDSFERRKE